MFARCPKCHAIYEIEPSAIPQEGIQAECARCHHAWFMKKAGLYPNLDAAQAFISQGQDTNTTLRHKEPEPKTSLHRDHAANPVSTPTMASPGTSRSDLLNRISSAVDVLSEQVKTRRGMEGPPSAPGKSSTPAPRSNKPATPYTFQPTPPQPAPQPAPQARPQPPAPKPAPQPPAPKPAPKPAPQPQKINSPAYSSPEKAPFSFETPSNGAPKIEKVETPKAVERTKKSEPTPRITIEEEAFLLPRQGHNLQGKPIAKTRPRGITGAPPLNRAAEIVQNKGTYPPTVAPTASTRKEPDSAPPIQENVVTDLKKQPMLSTPQHLGFWSGVIYVASLGIFLGGIRYFAPEIVAEIPETEPYLALFIGQFDGIVAYIDTLMHTAKNFLIRISF